MSLFRKILPPALILLASCSSNKHFYPGTQLQAENLATIYANGVGLQIARINETSVGSLDLVRLAYAKPGPSEIEVNCSYRMVSTTFYTQHVVNINLLAGGVYYIDTIGLPCDQLRTIYLGKNYPFLSKEEYLKFTPNEIRERIERDIQQIHE